MSSRVNEGAPRVKNRAPAAIQITAEQLLREVSSYLLTPLISIILISLLTGSRAAGSTI